jgi:3-dehydrosphinganine reductase
VVVTRFGSFLSLPVLIPHTHTCLSLLFLLQSSKFALNGLAQALAMELASRKILVSVAYPPDTDTPGLAAENVNKPSITKRLSEATSTVPPEVVGKAIVGGMEQWSPTITVGFDGWMLATLCSGFTPVGTVVEGVVQVLTVGLWRLVAIFYVNFFYGVVLKGDK